METPFTTLLTKGETGQQSAPGFFQDATMRCVKREEKRSPAITVRYEKNSTVLLEAPLVGGMGISFFFFFTVLSNPEIQLKS